MDIRWRGRPSIPPPASLPFGENVNLLRDYGWLLTGAVAAALTVAVQPEGAAVAALSRIAPLPWSRLGVALLVFASFAGLHFRLQLVRSLERERDQLERNAAASRLIRSASSDGRRWLRVVQENLQMVDEDAHAERERKLYLDGARANADKLEQAFDRIEGNQQRLDELDGQQRP